MAPKKGKKISLNEFLGDNTLGSWADEMDALPSAPAAKTDDDNLRGHDRFAKREDPVNRPGPPREDIPLPSRPPYTAFIGNLAFDLTEMELQNFFPTFKPKSVKIIRDREDKPKGFGYVEFDELNGLKDALAKTGSNLAGRIIRVSVAEPPKERGSFPSSEDASKFDSPWRREGPLPDIPEREQPRRRFDGLSSHDRTAVADYSTDWRSNRPRAPEPEAPPFERKGFSTSSAKNRSTGKNGGSPTVSTPPTPQMGRRKLELLPRSGNGSSNPSPMSSPKMSPAPSSTAARPNPFGAAKPVDVSQRDKEVSDRLERERGVVKERLSMSRTSSHGASERPVAKSPQSIVSQQKTSSGVPILAPNVRPSLSFANVAASKGNAPKDQEPQRVNMEHVAEKLADIAI